MGGFVDPCCSVLCFLVGEFKCYTDIITAIFLVHSSWIVCWFPDVYSLNDTPVAESFLDMGVVEGNVGDL